MQFTNAIVHLQQVNATSNSIEHGNLLAISKQIFLDIPMRYHSETTGAITLNCSGLEPINSHGINLLIMLLIYSMRQHKRLQVFGLSEYNKYIFEITRLSEFIEIVSTQTQTAATVHMI